MTVIVAYKTESGALLVGDRVWYGYGSDRQLATKLFKLSDCAFGIAGDHRTIAIAKATCFTELCAALEAQHRTDALIVMDGDIYTYHGDEDDRDVVRRHECDNYRVIGSYHNPVAHAIDQGLTPVEAVMRVHQLWGCHATPDEIYSESPQTKEV